VNISFSAISCALVSSLIWTLPAAAAASKTWKVAESQVTFQAVGKPGFIRINGKNAKVDGSSTWDGTQLQGEYKVKLSDLETGLSLRDQHMKEKYLEVQKYPEAILTLDPIPWNASSESSLPFKGKLKLHGVEQAIEGQAKLSPNGSQLAVEASFELILSQFKIDIPVYAGITVAEKVDVKVTFDAKE
jgi:polyisoprenoid-binding protein YceI